ncbi:MAG: metallophosphoesterase [Treponema sp.]|nr:metallophosphoesterase [Treponema sp.]
MILKRFLSLIFIPVSLSFFSCSYGFQKFLDHGESVEERLCDLTDITAASVSGSPYSFLIITDVHFGNSKSRRDDDFINVLQSKINDGTISPAPSFAVCLGDIADHGKRSEYEQYNNFASRIEGIIGGKVYNVVGNHDLYNNGWDEYEELIYPYVNFYRFSIGSISYYFLDTGSGSMGKPQFNSFKSAMANDSNYKIVCTHYPAYGTSDFFASYYSLQNTLEADQVLTLLKESNVIAYLSGHMHAEHHTNFGSFTEYVVPAFLSNEKFAVMTVNESSHSASYESYGY